MALAAVVVAAIDEHPRIDPRRVERGGRRCHVACVVVGTVLASAQDDVPVRIARRTYDRDATAAVDAYKTMGPRRGNERVDGDIEASVRPVLVADGHREAAGHLAVRLALGGARTD